LRCPNDGETTLVAETLDRVAVHDCPQCAGVWFVRDELRRAKDNADEWIRWIDDDLFAAATAASEATTKKCAECGEPMRSVVYPHSDVRIEVCVTDHGVWLDKGEFDKIVKELDQLTNVMSVSEYEHATAEQLKEIFRPHESRWSEIKDFCTVFQLLEMRFGTGHPGTAAAVNAAARIGL
jgi:Zn-finger nucleic acid-binding protein